MKKFLVSMLSLVMVLAMAFGLAACGDRGNNPGGGTTDTFSDIAGDYGVDLSGAGMPMTVYLRIGSDGAFVFSSKTGFTDSKSAGNVSKLSSGYMMLFTSVNGSAVETGSQSCNFTKESDGSLKFDGTIPYGTATFSSPIENEDTGETVTLYAVPLSQGGGNENTNTVTAGVYYAEYETTGMMQTTYKYYLTLREDGKFTALVNYAMDEDIYLSYDYGTYSVNGAACRMASSVYQDADDSTKDLTESLTVDASGVYTADVKMSRMASDTVSVTVTKLSAAPTEVVAAYEGTEGSYAMELSILADGSYTFTATAGGTSNTEEGFIGLETAMTGTGILLPDGMTSPADITIDETSGALTASLPLGSSRTQVTLAPAEASQPEPPAQLTEIVPGVYYTQYTKTGAMATTYNYYITLQEGNTYKAFVSFSMGGSAYACYDYGTYAVTGGTECALTSSVYSGVAQTISLADGTLSGDLRMSSMAQSNVSVTLESVSDPTDVFMTYTASYEGSNSTYGFELTVLVDGSYVLTCDTQMMGMTFTETGYIGLNLVSGNGVMFPEEGEQRTVTVADDAETGATTLQFEFNFGPLKIDEVFTPAA